MAVLSAHARYPIAITVFTRMLAVREVASAGLAKPCLPDRVREALRTRHYSPAPRRPTSRPHACGMRRPRPRPGCSLGRDRLTG